jgi:hypothetical protein
VLAYCRSRSGSGSGSGGPPIEAGPRRNPSSKRCRKIAKCMRAWKQTPAPGTCAAVRCRTCFRRTRPEGRGGRLQGGRLRLEGAPLPAGAPLRRRRGVLLGGAFRAEPPWSPRRDPQKEGPPRTCSILGGPLGPIFILEFGGPWCQNPPLGGPGPFPHKSFCGSQLDHGLAPLGLWIPLPSASPSVRVASLNLPPFVMQGHVLTPGPTILGMILF